MDEQSNSVMIAEQSLCTSRSNFKIMGEKRTSTHLGEKNDLARKRIKMSDLGSVIESAEANIRFPESTKEEEQSVQLPFGKKNMLKVTEAPVALGLDVSLGEKSGSNTSPVELNPSYRPLDLNTEANGVCAENPSKEFPPGKHDPEHHMNCVKSKGIDVDLNIEDVTSSINLDPAHSHKEPGHFKSKDISESGSCTGPVEEKDPLRIWKEMKQNGFLSSSHGGIPVPKQRGRKGKKDVLKKKMELAKRDQVNRFTKIAAPSGLLNELNPGIINHVRNRKQVHSIIEALVRSENHENGNVGSKQSAHLTSVSTEVSKRDLEHMTDAEKHQLTFGREEGTLHRSSWSRQTRKCPVTMDDSCRILQGKVGDSDTCAEGRASIESCVSQSTHVTEDDILALKLSSSTKASMSFSSLSNEESSNFTSVSSLSLKAATVSSQWLELLYRDVKGRLSALRRSRRRVRAVITTALPFLLSKEFSSNQENDPHVMKFSAGFSSSKTADMHRARWTALFDQMDEALSQEEKLLESWLNQVKEKQLLCDQGLQHVNSDPAYGLQMLGTSENDSRVWVADSSEKELAVNAAAASIYSTCNFLLSES